MQGVREGFSEEVTILLEPGGVNKTCQVNRKTMPGLALVPVLGFSGSKDDRFDSCSLRTSHELYGFAEDGKAAGGIPRPARGPGWSLGAFYALPYQMHTGGL